MSMNRKNKYYRTPGARFHECYPRQTIVDDFIYQVYSSPETWLVSYIQTWSEAIVQKSLLDMPNFSSATPLT